MNTNKLNDNFVKITVIDNPVEAGLFKSILEECDIPFIIKENHDSAYDGIFESVKGWGIIYSPEKYKNEIIKIIDDLRSP